MLSLFRRGVTAKIMLIVLGVGLVAIVVTGFGTGGMGGIDVLGSLNSDAVAKVEGRTITTRDLSDEADRQLTRMRQRQPELDMATFLRDGALEEIADQMITIAASTAFAREQGLGVSKQMIDREIASVPAFQNAAGQFDPAAFRTVLAQEKITESKLRQEIETQLLQRQLILPPAGSARVPAALARQYAALLLESRTGIVGAVPTEAMGPGPEPTEADIAAFYRANVAGYTIPERRVVRFAVFGPETVAAQAKATDAEIEAAYRQNAAAYGPRETRTLSQVVIPDEAAARAIAQKVAAGTGFAQAAQQAGYSAADIALGDKSPADFARISSPAVAQAAFAAAKGATVGPVRSPIGWHIVHIDNIKIIPGKPLTAARAEIAAAIERQKSQNAVADVATRIENAIQEGGSFAEIVQREKLTVQETAPVTASGAAPTNPGWQAPAELRPLLESAFAMEANDDPAVEPIVENERFALFTVTAIQPAAPPPYAQIRDRVRADLIIRRASDRARAVATSIVSRINAGMPPAQAFAQSQIKLPAPKPITAVRRDIARENQPVPPPLAMLFNLPRGKARLLPGPNGRGWFIVYLETIVPGDVAKEPQVVQAVRSQLAQVLGDEYAQQFSAAIRAGSKVKRNEDAFRKLKAQLIGNGAPQ